VLPAQLFLAEAQHGAKGGIDKQQLPFHVFNDDPDRTCVENIAKELRIRRSDL